jgi:hypothetical protein
MIALNEARGKPGMSLISILLNLLWIIFGGLWMAAGLDDGRSYHGDHHYRPAVDTGGLQHRHLHAAGPSARRRSHGQPMDNRTWVPDLLA